MAEKPRSWNSGGTSGFHSRSNLRRKVIFTENAEKVKISNNLGKGEEVKSEKNISKVRFTIVKETVRIRRV